MGSIRVEAFRSLQALAPLRAQISALNLEARRPCPFSTLEYVETFLAYDEDEAREDEVLFLVAFDGPLAVGYAPLRKFHDRLLGVPYGRIGFLVSHDTDRPHVVARRADEARCCAAFYEYLLERERSWSCLEFGMQDAESGLDAVPRVHPLRLDVRRFDDVPNTTIPMKFASLAEYYQSLGARQRSTIERRCRRLLSAGKIQMLTCSYPRARAGLLELYLDLEERSWKGGTQAGILRSPRRVDFFRALCKPEQPFELAFDFVLHDELPVAGWISGAFAGGLHGLEIAFDREYEHLGPGHLLILMAVRRAIEGRYHSLNLNGNNAYYTARIGGVVTKTSSIQLYRVGSLIWLKARCEELMRRVLPSREGAADFYPERRRAMQPDVADEESESTRRSDSSLPSRGEERARACAVFDALERNGVRVERLDQADLQRILPFSVGTRAA